jgi:hypothetical protein
MRLDVNMTYHSRAYSAAKWIWILEYGSGDSFAFLRVGFGKIGAFFLGDFVDVGFSGG